MSKSENKSFISLLKETVADFVKHPKKLLPTVILTLVWIVFSILSTVGVNIPILRFLYALTYANGGMFGGFFGAIGGIFGKAVFAAVVNGLVLSICAKKNPFKGLKGNLSDVFGGGAKAVAPFALGGGVGILLYFFFNITSSTQNCAIAIAAALAGIKALANRNGLLFFGVFWLLGNLSKGKTPSKVTASRVLAGLTTGFTISFPITFIRLPILIVILGILLTAVGILIPVIGKNKVTVAFLCLVLSFSAFAPSVYAENDLPEDFVDPTTISDFSLGGNLSALSNYDGFYLVPEKLVSGFRNYVLNYDLYYSGISMDDPISVEASSLTLNRDKAFDSYHVTGSYSITTKGFKGDMIDYSGYSYSLGYSVDYTLSNIRFDNNRIIADYSGTQTLNYSTDQPDVESSTKENVISGTGTRDDCIWSTEKGVHYLTLYSPEHLTKPENSVGIKFRLTGVLPAGSTSSPSDSSEEESDEAEYVPYRGRLTYTNGRVNKYGQPFPDLMDFDGDGEITWLDVNIQKELSHDPDWLDRPESKAAGVLIAILTGVFGAAVGTIGGAIGGAVGGAASSAAAEAASGIADGIAENIGSLKQNEDDLGPYIQRDSDGDLNVKDPATGERRLYKANGDGTYTNPLTGATYSEAELKSSLESRVDNADVIRQDDNTRKTAVDSQREDAKGLSEFTKQLEKEKAEELAKAEREHAHDVYVEKQKIHYGVETETDLRAKIGEEQGKAEIEGYEQLEYEKEYEKSQKYTETVKQVADAGIDVLAEIEPTGAGKAIKDTYTVASAGASNIGDLMAGEKSAGGAFVQTFVDAGVGLAKNHAGDLNLTGTGGYAEKAIANITGDGIAATSDSLMKGESLEKALESGSDAAKQGGINFMVDSSFDGIGKKFGSESTDVAGKIFSETITKKGATEGGKAFGADVVKNTLSPDDQDEAAHEKFIADREKAEEAANKVAAEHFRQSQKEWEERKND